MNSINLTLGQSVKVWWSFIWRTWLMMLPLVIGMALIVYYLVPHDVPGQRPSQGVMYVIFVLYAVMVVVSIIIQSLALKNALKQKWSDFHFVAVKSEGKS